ncbi:MAG TPA: DNA gyrase inhibitor YacG [Candidatus Acidoferrum sp.]|nr:DNA gyrase inhibitor YacG [Candidatus Acidoferrum sp.]
MKHKCPICKTETDSTIHAEFPFCSRRCRERDLGNWATEKYVVSEPIFDEEDMIEGEKKTIALDPENPDDASQ